MGREQHTDLESSVPSDTTSAGLWQSLHELELRVQQLTESNEAKSRVLDVLGRVTGAVTVGGVCRTIVEGVREALCIDRVGLFVYDADSGCFRGTFGTALDGQTTDERLLAIDVWPGSPWEELVQGANIVRGCELGEPEPLPGEAGATADLIALRHEARLYGVISVDNRISKQTLPDEALEHLQLLSPVLGNTVELSLAKSALARSEERLAQVAEHNADWIWELDHDGRYSYCSPVAARLLGYEPTEVLGHHVTDFVDPADQERMTDLLREMQVEHRSPGHVSNRHVHKHGHVVVFESLFIPIVRPGGYVAGFWGAHRDVSRERELENELRHSQKMESIGRLAGGIAHDFNNVLTTILGCCNLLLEDLVEGDPVCADIEQIQTAGERAARLTQQLLAFSRKQIMSPKPLNMNEVATGMEDLLRRALGGDVDLAIRCDPDLPEIESDADQLQQVILHLAVNAREAMTDVPAHYQPELWAQHGAPTSRIRRLSLETSATHLDESYCVRHPDLLPGDYVLLTVADTGIGIPKDVQDHIFEPFFTTKETGQGSGLGLSTVYGIIKQMGGDIQVHSQVGEGTVFQIYLPIMDKNAGITSRGIGDDVDLRGLETVLVVEDDERVRNLMLRMLEAYGYRALQAAGGAEGLMLCHSPDESIDLVITDMIMPKMTGKEFVEALRRTDEKTPVLFMSGYSEDATVDGQVLGGEAAFIQKPFSRDQLVRAVRRILDADRPS